MPRARAMVARSVVCVNFFKLVKTPEPEGKQADIQVLVSELGNIIVCATCTHEKAYCLVQLHPM